MSDSSDGARLNDTPLIGRRTFLWGTAVAAALPIITEGGLAQARLSGAVGVPPPGAVVINANENPLGPCKTACEAIINIAPHGGRYDRMGELDTFVKTYAAQQGLKPEYVTVYAGSSEPLYYTVLAFTSPSKSLVVADPSYEAPMMAANAVGAPIKKVALTSTYAHDVKAMVAADPSAGVIYICNPNNPTGTVTSREDILWALANKPAGSILLVDEAYIHLSDEQSLVDMVAAGKDLIVLRTFSKIYGMAGIRCGVAMARPDLLAKLMTYGQNPMPITALVAAQASINEPDLVPSRKAIIGDVRRSTVAWLQSNGYKVIGDPKSNCFMIDTGHPGHNVITAMQTKNVYIGRIWPVWPNAVRITVGTADDMSRFQVAFKEVMDNSAMAASPGRPQASGYGMSPIKGSTFLS